MVTVGDWSSDDLHKAIASSDSRCQARLSHRMAGYEAVTELVLNGQPVKACRQCADEIEVLIAYSSKRGLPLD